MAELPFMATEKILMEAVNRGMSRQDIHEIVKEHSIAAGRTVKEQGRDNDLMQRLADDDRVPFSIKELQDIIADQNGFVGRAPEQTEEYLKETVYPLLERYEGQFGTQDSILTV